MRSQHTPIRLVAVWLVVICVIVVAAAVSQASNAWLAAAIVVTSLNAGAAGAFVVLAWPGSPDGVPSGTPESEM